MAEAGTVAVLLPGAFHVLPETQLPPLHEFRPRHVPMAVATDCNPGTSPLLSLLQAMQQAYTPFPLTTEKALRAATVNGARTPGLPHCGRSETRSVGEGGGSPGMFTGSPIH